MYVTKYLRNQYFWFAVFTAATELKDGRRQEANPFNWSSSELVALVVSDADTFLADSHISDNDITTGHIEASNSSTSATITITKYATPHE